MSRTITARYPGVCTECPTRIVPGDLIISAGFNRGRYQHAECPEDAELQPANTRFVGSTDDEMGF